MAGLQGDNPIQSPEDDALGRASIAQSFAQEVLTLDRSEGLVVGVLGAWGSGKTSFINLARPHLTSAGAVILDFNPWMFSGAEQLVERFFIEIAAQLKVRPGFRNVAVDFEKYGEMFAGLGWLPVVGGVVSRIGWVVRGAGKLAQRRKEGIAGRRDKLRGKLETLEKPIVVVLDDIDRLSTSEIRDVFKLVRLTASFPNLVYVVAFDRKRVETALSETGVPGRDYLEKILQLAVDLPAVPESVLLSQIAHALNRAVEGYENAGPFNANEWPDVLMEVVRPLVRNMRDIRRYAASVRGTVRSLEGQIELVDVLALEAVHVFLPDVFTQLHDAVEGLTTTRSMYYGAGSTEPPHLKEQVERVLHAAENRESVVRAMIGRLFPAAGRHLGGSSYLADWKVRWLRDRRVAHEDVLRLYLERVVGHGLQAFNEAEKAWALLADRDALDTYLRSLDRERLVDVVSALETYESEFKPEQVVPATIVLMNLLPDLPERARGLVDPDNRIMLTRVTYRLVRSLKEQVPIAEAVGQILLELRSLSVKQELILKVGYRKGAGHKLVSEEAARRFETAWRNEVRAAGAEQLKNEHQLFRVLLHAKLDTESEEPPLLVHDAPDVTLALLRSARSEVISGEMGTRAVQRSWRLPWDSLVELYGDEETLKARIQALGAIPTDDDRELLELAEKYVGGWRPNDFGDDDE